MEIWSNVQEQTQQESERDPTRLCGLVFGAALLGATVLIPKAQAIEMPKPAPELAMLDYFIGTFECTGEFTFHVKKGAVRDSFTRKTHEEMIMTVDVRASDEWKRFIELECHRSDAPSQTGK
jgi:hypothetical protein